MFLERILFCILLCTAQVLCAGDTCGKGDDSCTNEDLRDFTVTQLKEYTGKSKDFPIYIALLGNVYDVSASADLYGEGKPFHCYAGRDSTLALSQNSCSEDLFPEHPLDANRVRDLSPRIQTALHEWIRLFESEYKYPYVGKVSAPELGRHYTLDDLSSRNGKLEHTQPNRVHPEILICLNYNVFDVSYGGHHLYGIGKGYSIFAGKDASRALAMMSFEPEYLNGSNDLSLLSKEEMDAVLSWESTYLSKYPVVGTCMAEHVTKQ